MKTETYKVNGMSCNGCANKVQTKLSKIEGVNKALVSLENNQVEVEYNENTVSKSDIKEAVEALGYELI